MYLVMVSINRSGGKADKKVVVVGLEAVVAADQEIGLVEVCSNKIKTSRHNSSIIINKAIINKQVFSHTVKETKKIEAKLRVKSERQTTEKMNDERKDDDKGWKFQKKKKGNKSIKYTVRD